MNKKLFITALLNIILFGNLLSQTTIDNYDFRTKWDEMYGSFQGQQSYYEFGTNYHENDWMYAWGPYLKANLRMFEATGDEQAYLRDFVSYSCEILYYHGDLYGTMLSVQRVNYIGQLISPMAEFIRIVKSNPSIYNTPFPSTIIGVPGTHINGKLYLDGQLILGYGDYANWLLTQIVPIADKVVRDYWRSNTIGFSQVHVSDLFNHNTYGTALDCRYYIPKAINQQVEWALIFRCLYLATNNYQYDVKATAIAQQFKNQLGSCNGCPIPYYTWFHNAGDPCDNLYREDVSHGAPAVAMAAFMASHSQTFTYNDMVKFAYTFTNNIWDKTGNTGFRNNVFGMSVPYGDPHKMDSGKGIFRCTDASGVTISADTLDVDSVDNFFAGGEILPWIVLEPYDLDASPNRIYEILLTHAMNLLENTPVYYPVNCSPNNYKTSTLPGAQAYYGLAEIVLAQAKHNATSPNYLKSTLVAQEDNEVIIDVEESEKEAYYHAYPNPASNYVNVKCEGDFEPGEIKLFNASGSQIKSYSITSPNTHIDIEDISRGIYHIVVKTENKVENIRFIKE